MVPTSLLVGRSVGSVPSFLLRACRAENPAPDAPLRPSPGDSPWQEQAGQTALSATINMAYPATPDAPGDYCVAIFDTGNVQVSSDFTLTVTHY